MTAVAQAQCIPYGHAADLQQNVDAMQQGQLHEGDRHAALAAAAAAAPGPKCVASSMLPCVATNYASSQQQHEDVAAAFGVPTTGAALSSAASTAVADSYGALASEFASKAVIDAAAAASTNVQEQMQSQQSPQPLGDTTNQLAVRPAKRTSEQLVLQEPERETGLSEVVGGMPLAVSQLPLQQLGDGQHNGKPAQDTQAHAATLAAANASGGGRSSAARSSPADPHADASYDSVASSDTDNLTAASDGDDLADESNRRS